MVGLPAAPGEARFRRLKSELDHAFAEKKAMNRPALTGFYYFYLLIRQAVQPVGQLVDFAVGGGDRALEAFLVGVGSYLIRQPSYDAVNGENELLPYKLYPSSNIRTSTSFTVL